MSTNIPFNKFYKLFNLISLSLIGLSIILLIFKGLNFGIDFKGGTLIELTIDSKNIQISDVRSAFSNMDLGDVNVKQFGKKGDYLIKFEKKTFEKKESIGSIKENVVKILMLKIKKIFVIYYLYHRGMSLFFHLLK